MVGIPPGRVGASSGRGYPCDQPRPSLLLVELEGALSYQLSSEVFSEQTVDISDQHCLKGYLKSG